MLKVFILVSGKTFFFLPSFASLNNANFSSERVLSCSASENKHEVMLSWFFLLVYENSFPSVIRFPFFKGARNLLPPPEMEGNARLLEWTINSYLQVIRKQALKN